MNTLAKLLMVGSFFSISALYAQQREENAWEVDLRSATVEAFKKWQTDSKAEDDTIQSLQQEVTKLKTESGLPIEGTTSAVLLKGQGGTKGTKFTYLVATNFRTEGRINTTYQSVGGIVEIWRGSKQAPRLARVLAPTELADLTKPNNENE